MEAILTNPSSVKNCIGWNFSPLPQVGSPVGNLKTTPAGLDSATKVGCKSQSYTSWDCVSRSYVGGVFVSSGTQAPIREVRQVEDIVGDIATPEERALFLPAQKILYDRGMKIFIRGKGLMTKIQFLKYQTQTQVQTSKDTAAGSSGVQTRS